MYYSVCSQILSFICHILMSYVSIQASPSWTLGTLCDFCQRSLSEHVPHTLSSSPPSIQPQTPAIQLLTPRTSPTQPYRTLAEQERLNSNRTSEDLRQSSMARNRDRQVGSSVVARTNTPSVRSTTLSTVPSTPFARSHGPTPIPATPRTNRAGEPSTQRTNRAGELLRN